MNKQKNLKLRKFLSLTYFHVQVIEKYIATIIFSKEKDEQSKLPIFKIIDEVFKEWGNLLEFEELVDKYNEIFSEDELDHIINFYQSNPYKKIQINNYLAENFYSKLKRITEQVIKKYKNINE